MFQIFQSFGPYQLLGELGSGGMGIVYLAHDHGLNRRVALKVIRPGLLTSEESRRRLEVEGKAAGSLKHPHIVGVDAVGQINEVPYLAMEYIPGGSLAERLLERSLAPREAARLLATVARSVAFAHQHGVLHRDLKPSNILLDDAGEPHLTDFGLAKLIDADAGLTVSAAPLGTCGYMAPEVAGEGARAATMASDIYSLGAILYELIAGRPPYAAGHYSEFLRQIAQSDPKPPLSVRASSREDSSSRAPKFERDLELICLHCLNREPAKRYPSAAALAEDLEHLLRSEPITARAPLPHELAAVWIRRHRFATSVAGATLLALLLGLVATVWQLRRAERFLAASEAANSELRRTNVRLSLNDFEVQSAKPFRPAALHDLAWLLRRYPTNEVVRARLWAALSQRNHAIRLLPPLLHPFEVYHAAYTADGRRLLTASVESAPSVHLWEVDTGKHLGRVPHDAERAPILQDRASTRLATVTGEGELRLWRLPGLEAVPGPWTNRMALTNAAFSASGRWLAGATSDGEFTVWDTERAVEAWTVHLPAEPKAMAFSTDESTVLIGDRAGGVHHFGTATGRDLACADPGIGRVLHIEANPKAPGFLLVGTNAFCLREGRVGPAMFQGVHLGAEEIRAAHYSPDGRCVAVATAQARLREYAVDSGGMTRPVETLSGDVDSLAYSPATAEISVTTRDGIAWFFARERGLVAHEPVKVGMFAYEAVFSPDGLQVAIPTSTGGVHLFSLTPRFGHPEVELVESNVLSWVLSPGGKEVALVDSQRRLGIRRLTAGSRFALWRQLPDEPKALDFSPSERWLVVRDVRGTASLYDSKQPEATPVRIEHGSQLRPALAFNADESRLALATQKEVLIWNLTGIEPRREARLEVPLTHTLQFSPDGRRLVLSSGRWVGDLYDTVSWERVGPGLQHTAPVGVFNFSRDSRWVASASQDHTARVWRTEDGTAVSPVLQNGQYWVSMALSPNGQELITGGQDRAIRRWLLPGGAPNPRELAMPDAPRGLQFSPDGRAILAYRLDRVQVWNAEEGTALMDPLRSENVATARFTNGGRDLMFIDQPADEPLHSVPSTLVVSRLPTDQIPPTEPLLALAQLVLDGSLNTTGGLEPLTAESLARLYREAVPILDAPVPPRSVRLRLLPSAATEKP